MKGRDEIQNALRGRSLAEAYVNLWGMNDSARKVGEVVTEKIINLEFEEPTCKEEICVGCQAIRVCDDALKYMRNLMKKRLKGMMSHDELMEANLRRFGEAEKRKREHWRDILGEYQPVFIKILNNRDELYKMELSAQEAHLSIEEKLLSNGWVMPHFIEDDKKMKLAFYSNIPIDKKEEVKKIEINLQELEPELDEEYFEREA